MNTQRTMNDSLSSLRKGLRQLGYAFLTTLPMLGSVQAATDEVVYFHTDALGSPVAAFNEAGEVCWTETYSPYGEKLDKEDSLAPVAGCGLLGTDVGYTGHVQDGSGLVYAQQRYYDPQIGRFMSTDPVMPSAGAPRYFGRYQYAANNPYRYTDPNGMELGSEDGDAYTEEQEAMAGRGDTSTSGDSTYEGSYGGDDTNDWIGYEDALEEMDPSRPSLIDTVLDFPGGKTLKAVGSIVKSIPKYARNKYKKLTKKQRKDALEKDKTCVYCGEKPSDTVDHVRSQKQDWAEGGWKDSREVRSARVNDPSNLAGACRSCNSSKGSKRLGDEWP